MKILIIVFACFLILGLGNFQTVQAQVEKVQIQVDGLACPFCAYGLEKKLKKVEGVGKVEINVKNGIATLQNKKGKSIAVEDLESVVKKAGFTPREITATVKGKLGQSDDTPIFLTGDAEVEFILQQNQQFQALRSKLAGSEKYVRITGKLIHKTPEGHHAHPFTLVIEKFEVLP